MIHISVRTDENIRILDCVKIAVCGHGVLVDFNPIIRQLSQSDLVYVTRVQRERFPDEESYLRCKGSYIVDNELLKCAKKDITIMHPLPRVDEIAVEVDSYPGAAYFRQAHNGMYLRMALLGLITGRI